MTLTHISFLIKKIIKIAHKYFLFSISSIFQIIKKNNEVDRMLEEFTATYKMIKKPMPAGDLLTLGVCLKISIHFICLSILNTRYGFTSHCTTVDQVSNSMTALIIFMRKIALIVFLMSCNC